MAATMPAIYDVSIQKTTVKLPPSTYRNHSTAFSPVMYKSDKIEIGPSEYTRLYEFENVTVDYHAIVPTMNVSTRRTVYPSGLPIRVGTFEN